MNKFNRSKSENGDSIIEHTDFELDEIQPKKLVDSSTVQQMNFITKETGVYRLVFSNDHSWYRGKTLMY